MPEAKPIKVVYLFGAGATHAELSEIEPSLASEEKIQRRLGLLMTNVSARVMKEARLSHGFLKGLEFLEPPRGPESVEPATGVAGAMNIELLISLIENGKIRGWEQKTRLLKLLVRKDIEERLSPRRRSRFYLHRALFELHKHAQDEELIGIISLNYDDVLDEAYKEFHKKPNYCLSFDREARASTQIPLLKLHGSFNWTRGVRMRERRRRVDIIPLGSNKNYVHAPYNFIWNRALEALIECDTLRVIGCSLSQNDTHLVDLLFKAHLERTPERMKTFEIDIINREQVGKQIRENYGFFPSVKTLKPDSPNPFRTWLTIRSDRVLGAQINQTKYLKRLIK
jgi:hypothetical protein